MAQTKGVLYGFCEAVAKRSKYGIDWDAVINALLPVIIELINSCFQSPAELAAFADGDRRPLQLAVLRIRANHAARDAGARGPICVFRTGRALMDGILAELDEQAAKMQGQLDVYQAAIDEAAKYH